MSDKLTYLDFQNSSIPGNLGFCPTDARLLGYLNRFRERAMNHGRWWGTIVRARFCVNDGCITWPGIVANVERIALNGKPIPIRSEWSDFAVNLGEVPVCGTCGNTGGRTRCGSCSCLAATDHLTSPIFNDPKKPKYIRLYPSSSQDVGKRVLIQGYDQNRMPIRNEYSGTWVDGEYLTLALPFVDSVAQYSAVTGVQKALTVLRVLAYQLDPTTSEELPLATWGATETAPNYRRSFIPFLGRRRNSNGGCCETTVDAIVKLGYEPVRQDTDWLILDNMTALSHGCRGEAFFDENRSQEAREQIALAFAELNHQLRTMTGDRTSINVDLEGCATFRKQFAGFR